MSYILEALKKAQTERQLGNAPTIHTPAPAYTVTASRGSRNPLVAGAIAGTLVVALGAVFLLRQPAPAPAAQVANVPAQALAPAAVPVPAAVPPTAPAAMPAAAPAAPAPVAAPPAPSAPAAPARPAERAKPAPAPTRIAAPAPAPAAKAEAAPRPEPVEAVPETPRPALVAAAPAAPVTVAPAAEDSIGPLQSLPEAVQREVPRVSFGGYIYSPNPAERLLLVDKMLRREGEEVAPGLVLERLLPKAAIMNFRGYRYRVAY